MIRYQNLFKKLLSAALILIAMGFAIPVCAQNPPPRMRPPDLNLSPEQQQKLRAHMRDTREKTESIRRDMWAARADLWRQFRSYHLDEKAAINAAKKINGCHLRLLNAYLESQVKLRSILSKDQFQKLSRAVGGDGDKDRPRQGFGGRPRMPEPEDERLGDVSHLNLSSSQQEKIRKLYEENRRTMEDLFKKQMADFRTLESLYLDYNLDQKRAKQLIKHINDIHMKIQEASIRQQIELRKILTEEQFNALKPKVRPPIEGMPGFGQGERGRRGLPDR
jgi:Spy/CpxP family protein refolding chaperone